MRCDCFCGNWPSFFVSFVDFLDDDDFDAELWSLDFLLLFDELDDTDDADEDDAISAELRSGYLDKIVKRTMSSDKVQS